MRTFNVALKTAKPSGAAAVACPPPLAGHGLEFVPARVLGARQWSAAVARPQNSAAEAFGAGYGDRSESAQLRAIAGRLIGSVSSRPAGATTKQELFHQMSRRDHRSWRPPA